jgi:dTDP-glucose 4,6-dehydratase
MMMPRALVTGGAGFLGSHLCDSLLADGWEVVALDNLATSRRENIAHLDGEPRFRFREADVTKPFDEEGEIAAVVHLASRPSPVDYLQNPIPTLETGSYGTQHALELARRKGARCLVASSSEVYGDPREHPQRETYNGNVNPVGRRSAYDESKRFSEALAAAYHRHHGVDTKIARIFNTYGPRMRHDDGRVVPAFILAALRGEPLIVFDGGERTRSFCYVSDLVDGLKRLLESSVNDPVNLGNPTEMSVREFAQLVIRLTGSESEIRSAPAPTADDPKLRRPDISRARERLGWQPAIGIEEGLRRTIEWFRRQLI